jgi:hypothetical protein
MRDKIKAIDWDKLSAMERGAAEIPDLLLEISSPTDQVPLDWKLRALYDLVVHQGPLFPHSAYVVPLLIDLIAHDTRLTAFVLGMLRDIAADIHLRAEGTVYRQYAEQSRREVGKGIDIYLSLLNDNDGFVRQLALELLAELKEYAPQIRPKLEEALESEEDPKQVEQIKRALEALT